jgi:hypothetical protein
LAVENAWGVCHLQAVGGVVAQLGLLDGDEPLASPRPVNNTLAPLNCLPRPAQLTETPRAPVLDRHWR